MAAGGCRFCCRRAKYTCHLKNRRRLMNADSLGTRVGAQFFYVLALRFWLSTRLAKRQGGEGTG
jgi:hypothetical protein